VAVDDVGRAVNPRILHGQSHGGIAQGVGQALREYCVYDADGGQLISGSFMDYAIPRADDLLPFTTEISEGLSPTNPLGGRAGGKAAPRPHWGWWSTPWSTRSRSSGSSTWTCRSPRSGSGARPRDREWCEARTVPLASQAALAY